MKHTKTAASCGRRPHWRGSKPSVIICTPKGIPSPTPGIFAPLWQEANFRTVPCLGTRNIFTVFSHNRMLVARMTFVLVAHRCYPCCLKNAPSAAYNDSDHLSRTSREIIDKKRNPLYYIDRHSGGSSYGHAA